MVAFVRVILALVISTFSISAFVSPSPPRFVRSTWPAISSPSMGTCALRMGWGDALGKAFANEDMGKAKNPGLAREPNSCEVTVNGKKVMAFQGQRLRDVVTAAKAKIEYGCEKGNCGTCESIIDGGKKVRICKAIVPRNAQSLTIKTKLG